MTSYTGIFLLVCSVFVVVLDTANFFAIGISFFIMLIGIMLVMVRAMGGFEKKSEAALTHTEVVREIVKVRFSMSKRVKTAQTEEHISD